MIVSGIPQENGFYHLKHISNVALDIMKVGGYVYIILYF